MPRCLVKLALGAGLTAGLWSTPRALAQGTVALSQGPEVYTSAFLGVPSMSEEFSSQGITTEYSAQPVPYVGLGATYKGITFAYSVQLPDRGHSSSDDEPTLDSGTAGASTSSSSPRKSRYQAYDFSYYRPYFGLEAGWHRYHGFNRTRTDTAVVFDPNMEEDGFYLNAVYIFNDDELQYRKGITDASAPKGFHWSPVGEVVYLNEKLRHPYALINTLDLSPDSGDAGATGVYTSTFAAAAGGALKYRHELWQVGAGMLLGPAYNFAREQFPDQQQNIDHHGGTRVSLRCAGEYLWDSVVFGFTLNYYTNKMKLNEADMSTNYGNIVFSASTEAANLKFW